MLQFMQDNNLDGRVMTAVKTMTFSDTSPVNCYNYVHTGVTSVFDSDYSDEECDNRHTIKDCFRFAGNERDYENILSLMRQYGQSRFDGDCVKLVKYPTCLDNYLCISCISASDLTEMICQCIESKESWAESSFDILAEELESFNLAAISELRLLRVENYKLYERAKKLQLTDPYHEALLSGHPYVYDGLNLIDAWNYYRPISYRDVFHLLMHGNNKHLQEIYIYLDLAGDRHDYNVVKALCDYFQMPIETSITVLKTALSNN